MELTQHEAEVFEYLDSVRESGIVNMFGSGPLVQDAFGVSRREAGELVVKWMETYADRHPK